MKRLFYFSLLLLFVSIHSIDAKITATQVGMLDFQIDQNLTAADMDGTNDVTVKLQNAIVNAQNAYKTLFIPSGTYKISAPIKCLYDESASPKKPVNIVGSSINHPLIKLADSSPNFNNENAPLAVISYASNASGHGTDWVMDGGIRALDFDLGEGNSGAVAIYWGCAQYCYVEDINIEARSGFAGFTNIGGANILFSNLTVNGGKHGIYLPDSGKAKTWNMQESPQNTLLGCKLTNQRSTPIYLWGWGPITLIGVDITTSVSPAIILKGSSYSSIIQFPFSLIDSKIEFTSYKSTNTAIDNNGYRCNVALNGVYAKNAGIICANNNDENLKPVGNTGEWTHVNRYNYISKTDKGDDASPKNVYVGLNYDALTGTAYQIPVVEVEAYNPPADLISKHLWDFTPSFEDEDTYLVPAGSSAAQIQRAIDEHQKVCLAKGEYNLTQPIVLRKNTIFFGSPGRGRAGAILKYGFNPTSQTWLIDTDDDADATTYLMDITTNPGTANYLGSLRWRAGRNSIIRTVRFDLSWDTYEKDLIRMFFTGNGGGKVYNYQDEKAFDGNVSGNSLNHRKVKALNTSQPLTFYGLCLERGGNRNPPSDFPMFEINNSSNIRIFGAKSETYQPYAKIINSSNIFMTNILDYVPLRQALEVNYIEIEGADCDNIEISNTMFIKPPSSDYLIVKDPWNSNTPHRLNNLGVYHRNWSDFWKLKTDQTSIKTQAASKYYIYPNITDSFFNVVSADKALIELFNLEGKKIRTINATSTVTNINISDLVQGVYAIQVSMDNKHREVFKVIKT